MNGVNGVTPNFSTALYSGTGKTYMIRAAATALQDTVVYFELTKSDLLSKWLGKLRKCRTLKSLIRLIECIRHWREQCCKKMPILIDSDILNKIIQPD